MRTGGGTSQKETATAIQPAVLIGLMLLSWLGMLVHNQIELPSLSLLSPEVILPTMLSLGLLLAWYIKPDHRSLWRRLILAWTSLHFLVGGILSVLPLPFWPFYPEQSMSHYLAHLFYAGSQLPLLGYLGRLAIGDALRSSST